MTDPAKMHVKSIVVAITTALTLLGGTEGISMMRGGDSEPLSKADVKELLTPLADKISDQGRAIADIRAKVSEFDTYMAIQRDREARAARTN